MEAFITDIINAWDPMRLAPGRLAPDDEYSSEIKKICQFIQTTEGVNETALAQAIENTFTRAFSDCYKAGEERRIAGEIVDHLIQSS
ncbi:Uncharacterised protein [Leminorella richardii]|uniref:DUF1871 domain-containing protein n=1 Tax=Leminorella richardii TaxID=158841 RepID=A0A2X4UWG8_9GAMM|nr:DUF1871 family protein [Leminorella richardii]SQI44197.1 Uncharacterised protein [Leminorella richardii]